MSTTTVPASVQYTVSMLTLPLVRSRSFPAATISLARSTLTRELLAMCNSNKDRFEIHLDIKPSTLPPKPILMACVNSGIKWARWVLHLGGKPVEFVIARNAVVALSSRRSVSMTLWQAEKPTLPSYATGLLGMKDEECPTPLPPVLKGLDAIEEERGISGTPITPMTALPSAVGGHAIVVERSATPFSEDSDSDSDSDDDNTFSDVESDTDTIVMPAPTSWRARALAKELAAASRRPQVIVTVTPPTTAAAAAAPPKTMEAVKCFRYNEGETGVVSGGVKLGMPSIAYGHADMASDEDGPVDEVVFFTAAARRAAAAGRSPVACSPIARSPLVQSPVVRSPLVRPTPVRATKGSPVLSGLVRVAAPAPSMIAAPVAVRAGGNNKGKQWTGAGDKAGSWRRA